MDLLIPRTKVRQVYLCLVNLLCEKTSLPSQGSIPALYIPFQASNHWSHWTLIVSSGDSLVHCRRGTVVRTVSLVLPVRGSVDFKTSYKSQMDCSNLVYLLGKYGSHLVQKPHGLNSLSPFLWSIETMRHDHLSVLVPNASHRLVKGYNIVF